MRKHYDYAKYIVASCIAAFVMPVHACGMAVTPGISDILCIDGPLEGLIAFSLLAAILVGLDSAISKAMRRFGRSSD